MYNKTGSISHTNKNRLLRECRMPSIIIYSGVYSEYSCVTSSTHNAVSMLILHPSEIPALRSQNYQA